MSPGPWTLPLGAWLIIAIAGCSGGKSETGHAGAAGRGGIGGRDSGGGSNASDAGGTATGSGGAPTAGSSGGGSGAGEDAPSSCTFTVDHLPSAAIGTVEIVTWSLDLRDLTAAHIDFGPTGEAPSVVAPVDLDEPDHRTPLLGMKGERPYTFRIVASSATTTCTSPEFSFTTGAVPSSAPKIAKSTSSAAGAKGFIVTTRGVDPLSRSTGQPDAYVFDTDGDIVWWSSSKLPSNNGISRAHMSWDGKQMWVMATNGGVISISMDGLTTTDYPELKEADHDLVVLPDGGIATAIITMRDPSPAKYAFVERRPDGTIVTVVADFATLYKAHLLQATPNYHPNAFHYHPADDTYTLSDRDASLFVKFKRNGGDLIWQLGGAEPLGPSFTLVGLAPWMLNHGHTLTADGRLLFFNNGATSKVIEVLLDETASTATKTWDYQSSEPCYFLGDVERLPSGNALITFSNTGVIQEVDPSGQVVQSFTATTFGYVEYRTSLYGPPLH